MSKIEEPDPKNDNILKILKTILGIALSILAIVELIRSESIYFYVFLCCIFLLIILYFRKKIHIFVKRIFFSISFLNSFKNNKWNLIIIFFVGLVIYTVFIEGRNKKLEYEASRIVVVISKFDGEGNDSLNIHKDVYNRLSYDFEKDDSVDIYFYDEIINENSKADELKYLEKKYNADLVVWGYLSVTSSGYEMNLFVDELHPEDYKMSKSFEDEYLNTRGDILYPTGPFEGPIEELNGFKVDDYIDDNFLDVIYYIKGELFLGSGEYPLSISNFKKIIENSRENRLLDKTGIYERLAFAYYLSENYEESIKYYTNLIDTDNPQVYWFLGMNYYLQHNYNQAINYFCLAMDKGYQLNNYSLYFLVASYLYEEEYLAVIDVMNKYFDLDSDFNFFYSYICYSYEKVGQTDDLMDCYSLAEEILDNSFFSSLGKLLIYNQVSDIYSSNGNYPEAIRTLSKAKRKYPEFFYIFANKIDYFYYSFLGIKSWYKFGDTLKSYKEVEDGMFNVIYQVV